MGALSAVLGLLGLSALVRKRQVPQPTARPATLMPPVLLLVGLAGIAVARARPGALRGR